MTLIDIGVEVDRIASFTPVRYPVLNNEPRVQMSGRKWHLIWERDGNTCWMCSWVIPKGYGEVDHVIPRSAFAVEDLVVADRSDNLRVSCVRCNQEKSNRTTFYQPRQVGVSAACVYCAFDDEAGPYEVPAYCGRCGIVSRVPEVGWLM